MVEAEPFTGGYCGAHVNGNGWLKSGSMYAYIPVPWSVWELTLHNILANGGLAFLCCRTSGENHVHGMACNMIKSEKAIHPLVTLVHQVVHQDRRLLLLIQRRTPL